MKVTLTVNRCGTKGVALFSIKNETTRDGEKEHLANLQRY
jgi:hypothetical protein